MRLRPLLIGLVIVVSAGVVWRVMRKPAATTAKTGMDGDISVTAAVATERDVPHYLTGLGRIQALNMVVVRPQIDGRIVSVPFQEGADVRAGEVLIQIDPRPYQALLDQAEGKLEQDQAQLDNARRILKRDSELLAKGMIDQQAHETQQSAVAQLAALMKTDAGVVAAARINLEFTRITSPIAGRVGLRQVDAGNLVHAADTTGLASVVQVQPIALVFTLPERDLDSVREAFLGKEGKNRLAVSAVDRDNRTVLDEGELIAIDNQIDLNSGTFKLKAVLKNPRRNLWPGEFVNARLLVGLWKHALVVPTGALQQGPDGDSVFVIGPDLAVELRKVRVEQSESGTSLVSAGLKNGDQVVVDGQFLLHPRERVRIKGTVSAPRAAQGAEETGREAGRLGR